MRCCNSHLQHLFFCLISGQSRKSYYRQHCSHILLCMLLYAFLCNLRHCLRTQAKKIFIFKSVISINHLLFLVWECACNKLQAQILLFFYLCLSLRSGSNFQKCKIGGRVAIWDKVNIVSIAVTYYCVCSFMLSSVTCDLASELKQKMIV